jgi:BMFP domain-containing protein YqiC
MGQPMLVRLRNEQARLKRKLDAIEAAIKEYEDTHTEQLAEYLEHSLASPGPPKRR